MPWFRFLSWFCAATTGAFSLHALKDESYLRQTMQKQAAQLHQASISFAADGPIGVVPVRPVPVTPASYNVKKPLVRASCVISQFHEGIMSSSRNIHCIVLFSAEYFWWQEIRQTAISRLSLLYSISAQRSSDYALFYRWYVRFLTKRC